MAQTKKTDAQLAKELAELRAQGLTCDDCAQKLQCRCSLYANLCTNFKL